MINNSFDVFDTCLTRKWAHPDDLFHCLGLRLQSLGMESFNISDYPKRRRLAELKAWEEEHYIKQPDLAQIYRHLALISEWSIETRDKAMKLEIALEIDSIMPVLQTLAVVKRLHKEGESIAYISDMYLPNEAIIKMLIINGFWHQGDHLFVSAEVGVAKYNGRLFKYVRKILGKKPFSIKHTGDNYKSDFIMAWLNGFRGQHFHSGLLHKREELAFGALNSHPVGSRLAAFSRITRLSYEGSPNGAVLWDAVTTGFAPLVFSFALHCLFQAKKQGYSDIFFCSRDGNLPMKVANIINEAYCLGLTIRYFRCSRDAWCKANLTRSNSKGLTSALEINQGLTIRSIVYRLGLGEHTFENIIDYLGENIGLETVLSNQQIINLLSGFKSGFLQEQLLKVEEENRHACIKYFTECGMNFDKGFLIVDAFSRGTIELLFDGIIKHKDQTNHRFSWVYMEFLNDKKRNSINSFLNPDKSKFPFSRIALAEALLATNEPPLKGYKINENGISLEFGKDISIPEEKQMHEIVHQACIMFAKITTQNLLIEQDDKELIDLYATTAFDSLARMPTKEEVYHLRSLPFEYWTGRTRLAKRPTLRDFAKSIRYVLKDRSGQLILDSPWMEGSLALADPISRRLIQLCIRQ